jgi:SAM-dependent methyltransferase
VSATGAERSCRFCEADLKTTFLDLGTSPLANSFLTAEQLDQMEPFYPLHAYICNGCLLVQLEEFVAPDSIFEHYAYFSSYSGALVESAAAYCRDANGRFGLDANSQVIEIASNDGYLLRNFVQLGVPVLGIEPAKNVAEEAIRNGVPTHTGFFDSKLARELVGNGVQADLLVANNVLAHVPALNDFVAGMKIILKPTGVLTLEFPHLMRLMERNQFDTIYHEHLSYFSFLTIELILKTHGITVFDVEEIANHGGSLRIFGRHESDESKPIDRRVGELRSVEQEQHFDRIERYLSFPDQVYRTKRALLSFLIEKKDQGKSVVAYGAPAKGNTLLNFCGIGPDIIDYAVDQSPHKQGLFLPGTRLPVHPPERLDESPPDYILLLAWNLKDEIIASMGRMRDRGTRFVTPIPRLEVFE